MVVRLALVALAFATFTGRANAQPPTNSVINCMTITTAGVYVVDGPLTQSGPGDCLLIKAANVTLDLNHQTVTGSGSGVGVHIEASAGNAFVEGAAATISGFADGIEMDGANAFAENFFANDNADAGVYLNAAKQARVARDAGRGWHRAVYWYGGRRAGGVGRGKNQHAAGEVAVPRRNDARSDDAATWMSEDDLAVALERMSTTPAERDASANVDRVYKSGMFAVHRGSK